MIFNQGIKRYREREDEGEKKLERIVILILNLNVFGLWMWKDLWDGILWIEWWFFCMSMIDFAGPFLLLNGYFGCKY